MHLIALFFRMPWFGYLIIAGLIAYFGYSQTDTVNQRIAEIEAAIARPAPEPVPLDLDLLPRFVDDPAVTDTGSGTPPLVDLGTYERQ